MIAIITKIIDTIRADLRFFAEVWRDARAMQLEAEQKWHLPRF